MKWKWVLLHAAIILLILIVGLSPLIVTAIAGTIAARNDCVLHEGFVNPCVINGVDRGQDLYTAGMMGWLAIATIPISLGVTAVYLVVVIVVALIRRNRRVPAT